MIKKILVIIALGTFLITGAAYAKMEEMVQQIEGMTVRLTIDMTRHNEDGHHSSFEGQHHSSVGANRVGITINDAEGTAITDAKIKLSYSMPPMDNMPPMKYTARAKRNGDTYDAKLNFSMKGDWDIVVYIKRPGKDLARANFIMHVM